MHQDDPAFPEAKSRISRLMHFLRDFENARQPPPRTVADHEWHLDLDALPRHSAVHVGYQRARATEDDLALEAEGILLRVRRVPESPCPTPPDALVEWLVPGWNRADGKLEVMPSRNLRASDGETVTENFSDDMEREVRFEVFRRAREEWVQAEKLAEGPRALYATLLRLRSILDRDSDRLRLVVADGFLRHPRAGVDHPILIQEVELTFDPNALEITIRETDEQARVFQWLLASLDDLVAGSLADVIQMAGHLDVRPLGGEGTSHFFQKAAELLWPRGRFSAQRSSGDSDEPTLYRRPVLLMMRRAGELGAAIDRLLAGFDDAAEVPNALARIVGCDGARERSAESGGAPRQKSAAAMDLLFTKQANETQENVARTLEDKGMVLVQGPPGTGKTHTIANLIGHLLAHGKSILVTSHTTKALRVLRGQVVPELQPLCVSVLDDDLEARKQLNASIDGIVDRLGRSDAEGLLKEAERSKEARARLKRKHADVLAALQKARRSEFEDITVGGQAISPSLAARRIAEGRGRDDWLPGPVRPGELCPLDDTEVRELYRLGSEVTAEAETSLEASPPDPAELLHPDELDEIAEALQNLSARTVALAPARAWLHERQTLDDLRPLLKEAHEALRASDQEPWWKACATAILRGAVPAKPWKELLELLKDAPEDIAADVELTWKHEIELGDLDAELLAPACAEMLAHKKAGGGLGFLATIGKAHWKVLLEGVKIDGRKPDSVEDFERLQAHLSVVEARKYLVALWNRLLVPHGAPDASTFGDQPEVACAQYEPVLRTAVTWAEERWPGLKAMLVENGVDWDGLFLHEPPDPSPLGDLQRIRGCLQGSVVPMLEERIRGARQEELQAKLDELGARLARRSDVPIVSALHRAVQQVDAARYRTCFEQLEDLHAKRSAVERRRLLLKKLETAAPAWAERVRRREPGFVRQPQGDVQQAWLHRQWAQEIEARRKIDLDALQKEASELQEAIHKETRALVEHLAWGRQIVRTTLKQQQALNGWVRHQAKIGKGTGKRAPEIRRAARELLEDCRTAVPVWIMPLRKVLESFDPTKTKFDVVIIDEASQADVTGLVALYLGKQAIVVGDHEQVSPLAVGENKERIQALIDQHLDGIPNRALYDGTQSVYDLARDAFGGLIRLVEHFRSVPEIIAFSNDLCYEGAIKPLRDDSQVVLRPAVVPYRVPDGRYDSKTKLNEREAEEVASLVVAAASVPEYRRATMGVISLVGDAQAELINQLLLRHLGPREFKERRIVCGNAAQFQGDERDVMFLSVVHSSADGPLPLSQQPSTKQRFNVAASRARDQMWVVHSLNPDTDLKEGDLRLRLIRHAQDPGALLRRTVLEKETESPFEAAVLKRLHAAGFRVVPQWKVGAFRIDLVVVGRSKRVAIECDGDRFHPPEKLEEDLRRQMILERLGWRFIRIRGSAFYSDPDAAMKRVLARLDELGIEPLGPAHEGAADTAEEGRSLIARVVRAAAEIRRGWSDAEASPSNVVPLQPARLRQAAAEPVDEEADTILDLRPKAAGRKDASSEGEAPQVARAAPPPLPRTTRTGALPRSAPPPLPQTGDASPGPGTATAPDRTKPPPSASKTREWAPPPRRPAMELHLEPPSDGETRRADAARATLTAWAKRSVLAALVEVEPSLAKPVCGTCTSVARLAVRAKDPPGVVAVCANASCGAVTHVDRAILKRLVDALDVRCFDCERAALEPKLASFGAFLECRGCGRKNYWSGVDGRVRDRAAKEGSKA